jgi:TPR repeat protein
MKYRFFPGTLSSAVLRTLLAAFVLTFASMLYAADTDIAKLKAKAQQGDAEAQFRIGLIFVHGQGVPKNNAEAAGWFRKAADQGHAEAQHNLGVAYDKGEGVRHDSAEAVKWFRKAAEQGLAEAQAMLGAVYGFGEVIPKNSVEAYKWLNLAAASGNKTAAEVRTILEREMTPGQIAEAQRLSAAWQPADSGKPSSQMSTKTYEDRQFHFAITPPPGWVKQHNDQLQGETVVKFFAPEGSLVVAARPAQNYHKRIIDLISKNDLSEKQLADLAQDIYGKAPGVIEPTVVITELSSHRALGSLYAYEHRSVGSVMYMVVFKAETIRGGIFYKVEIAGPVASTLEAARKVFSASSELLLTHMRTFAFLPGRSQ